MLGSVSSRRVSSRLAPVDPLPSACAFPRLFINACFCSASRSPNRMTQPSIVRWGRTSSLGCTRDSPRVSPQRPRPPRLSRPKLPPPLSVRTHFEPGSARRRRSKGGTGESPSHDRCGLPLSSSRPALSPKIVTRWRKGATGLVLLLLFLSLLCTLDCDGLLTSPPQAAQGPFAHATYSDRLTAHLSFRPLSVAPLPLPPEPYLMSDVEDACGPESVGKVPLRIAAIFVILVCSRPLPFICRATVWC